ncbi:MAG: ATP-binding protein [Bacteroidota bacterium]
MKSSNHILITGPESSGKSALARDLAWCTDGVMVREYAREYLSARGNKYDEKDLLHIWRGQYELENKLAGDHWLFCDTGPLVIKIWSEVKFQSVHPVIKRAAADLTSYTHIFLCTPDLPWQPDPLREAPDLNTRERLFQQYQEALLPYSNQLTIIQGQNRVAQALDILFKKNLKSQISNRQPLISNR